MDELRRGTDAAIRLIGPRQQHCVPRALTLFALLTREGHQPDFVGGVRREDGRLTGHAWVEIHREAVEAPGHHEMSTMYREQLRVPSRTRSDRISSPAR